MTSNAGTGKVEANVGFGAAREGVTRSVLNQLNNYFTPEFLNRFDGIIEFKALSKRKSVIHRFFDARRCQSNLSQSKIAY